MFSQNEAYVAIFQNKVVGMFGKSSFQGLIWCINHANQINTCKVIANLNLKINLNLFFKVKRKIHLKVTFCICSPQDNTIKNDYKSAF